MLQGRHDAYSVGHKATVTTSAALVIISGPHDLPAADGAETGELLAQHLLIHLGCQVANIQIGGERVPVIKGAQSIIR